MMRISISIFIVLFEVCLLSDFMNDFFTCGIPEKWKQAACQLGFCGLVLFISSWQNPVLNLFGMFAVYILFGLILFVPVREAVTGVAFFYLIGECIRILTENLLAGFSGMNLAATDTYGPILVVCISKVMILVVVQLLKLQNRKAGLKLTRTLNVSALLLPAVSLLFYLVLIYEIQLNNIQPGGVKTLVLISLLLLISNLVSLYVYNQLTVNLHEKQQLELSRLKAEMNMDYFTQQEEQLQEQARFRHNMRHYLSVIGGYAKQNSGQEIGRILAEMDAKLEATQEIYYCPHETVNIILNEYKQKAFRHNINMKIDRCDYLNFDFVDEIDLIAMLSNLLENAFEAALKRPDGFVRVEMFMGGEGRAAVFKVRNNFLIPPRKSSIKFLTTKTESEGHGIGLSDVEKTAAKYEGNLLAKAEGQEFTAILMLPVRVSETE